MGSSSRLPRDTRAASWSCGCDPEKIRAFHTYLKEHFPEFGLRDFHAPTRLMGAGLPAPPAEHHVVSVTREDILPYHAVFLNDFQAEPLDDLCAHLRQWQLADTLRAHRIAVVSKHGASPL